MRFSMATASTLPVTKYRQTCQCPLVTGKGNSSCFEKERQQESTGSWCYHMPGPFRGLVY